MSSSLRPPNPPIYCGAMGSDEPNAGVGQQTGFICSEAGGQSAPRLACRSDANAIRLPSVSLLAGGSMMTLSPREPLPQRGRQNDDPVGTLAPPTVVARMVQRPGRYRSWCSTHSARL